MEHGPATNLRQTPGRRANNSEKTFRTPKTPKGQRKKRTSGKKKLSTSGKKNRKDKPIVDSQPALFQSRKSLLPQFEKEHTSIARFFKKKVEDGYATDPEIEIRNAKLGKKPIFKSIAKLEIKNFPRPKVSGKTIASQLQSANVDLTNRPLSVNACSQINNNATIESVTKGNLNSNLDQRSHLNGHVVTHGGQARLHKRVQEINCSTNNRFQALALSTSGDDSDARCLIDDCNYLSGEITETTEINTMAYPYPITTTAYINTTTSPTFSSILLRDSATVTSQQYTTPYFSNDFPPLTTHGFSSKGSIMSTVTNTGYTPTPTPATTSSATFPVPPAPPLDMPTNMDMPTLFRMLTHISGQVAAGNQETAALRQEMTTYNTRIDEVAQDIDDQQQVLDSTIAKYNKCVDSVDVLSGVTVRHDRAIEQLQKKISNMEAKLHNHKLILHGLVEKEGENPAHVVLEFFKTKLLITDTIELQEARRVGNAKEAKVRPIEVSLVNIKDKAKIYKHTKNLKDVKNENGYSYQIRDVLPETLQEEDSRRRQIMGNNRRKAKK